jgi:hypothetical protein
VADDDFAAANRSRRPRIARLASLKSEFSKEHKRRSIKLTLRDQRHLDAFLQSYAVEKARIEARKKGHTVTEQQLANGSLKLTINVGGAT